MSPRASLAITTRVPGFTPTRLAKGEKRNAQDPDRDDKPRRHTLCPSDRGHRADRVRCKQQRSIYVNFRSGVEPRQRKQGAGESGRGLRPSPWPTRVSSLPLSLRPVTIAVARVAQFAPSSAIEASICDPSSPWTRSRGFQCKVCSKTPTVLPPALPVRVTVVRSLVSPHGIQNFPSARAPTSWRLNTQSPPFPLRHSRCPVRRIK
jgi:hypothetical protein